ncbi:hypothetical protein FrEUN1fDRAFT_5065 [Parafrankia sp. EUN1f]|nr:hypothetical protein FrEUN1fDRAFT_5065 [Parafrankia sp. EUN1f]
MTVIVGVMVALTFCFGFGNGLALRLRLGVPVWVAPPAAPAVGLSIVALLLGSQQLAVSGRPVEVLRAARRLLLFASMVALALNIAEPLIAGRYGKAAFDAVGPLLLIGWAEVAPGLLQAIEPRQEKKRRPTHLWRMRPSDRRWSTNGWQPRPPRGRRAPRVH